MKQLISGFLLITSSFSILAASEIEEKHKKIIKKKVVPTLKVERTPIKPEKTLSKVTVKKSLIKSQALKQSVTTVSDPAIFGIHSAPDGSPGIKMGESFLKENCAKVFIIATDPNGKTYSIQAKYRTTGISGMGGIHHSCGSGRIEVPANVSLSFKALFLSPDYKVTLERPSMKIKAFHSLQFGFVKKG